jgi:RNA polymerase sigma-70 factor (ECF subfamily)
MQEPRLAQSTDHAQIERVYRKDGPRLQRALLLFTGDSDVASDAAAEAFAQALRRGGALRSPRNWIWKTAFRIANGAMKERRSATYTNSLPEATYDVPRVSEELIEALRQLSPRQRQALVLHYFAGYSAREVASLIGSSPPAVFVHLSQGRKRLRRILEDIDG